MMSMKAIRTWRMGVSAALCLGLTPLGAQAAPTLLWISECPSRLEQESWCHLLPSEGLMALRVPVPGDSNGLWGFVDQQGRMVIAPVYESVMAFSQGLAAARKDNQWGFIDTQGRWRIQPQYDDVTAFDAQGVAWAVRQGDLLRLGPQGEAVRWLPDAGEFDLDHGRMREQGGMRLRVVPPPEAWRLDTGAVVRWPTAVKEIGRVAGGAWPLRVKLPSGRVWWGIWSLQEGRWLASPQVLRSESEPLFHGEQVAVQRGGQWLFVNWQGQALSPARYREVEMDLPGLWVVSPEDSTWEWLAPDLSVLNRIEGRLTSPPHQRWGDAMVYDLGEELLLCFPGGRVQRLDLSQHTELVHDDWIWLSGEEEALPDLIGPDGQSRLSEAERRQLKGHRVQILWEEEASAGSLDQSRASRPRGAILAVLHPTDANAAPGVITADLKVVTHADWAMVMPGQTPTDPVVVQRIDGRFGTIDGQGQWVIPPEWLGLEPFHHGLTWGRHPTHEGGSRPVLIGTDGARLPLPDDVFTSCSGWVGRWLRCVEPVEPVEGPRGVSFLDPLTQHRLQAAEVDELSPWRAGWLLARQDQTWGLLDERGAWRLPPLARSPDAIEWLDDEVVRLVGREQDQPTHQLWHLPTGRALTAQPRAGRSWRLAPDRYLVAGAEAGLELLDAAGRVVLHSPWWDTEPQVQGGVAWLTHGQQFAHLHPDGSLLPEPIHLRGEGAPRSYADEAAAQARALRGWQLRLSARCGQLIVHGPTGRQTWPTQPVRCRQP
jgi:hypothetical protein